MRLGKRENRDQANDSMLQLVNKSLQVEASNHLHIIKSVFPQLRPSRMPPRSGLSIGIGLNIEWFK